MKFSVHTLHRFMPLVSLVLFSLALVIVHHEVQLYHWTAIKEALIGIPMGLLFQMALATALGYLALCFYDYLALEYVGEKLPFHRVALASFLSYALSNNVGHAIVSGGSMRFRFYSGWGISATSIAKVILFCSLTYFIGALTLFFISYATLPEFTIPSQIITHTMFTVAMGVSFLMLACWWGAILFYRKEITLKNIHFDLPKPSLAFRQLLVSLLDLLLASIVLYLPIMHAMDMPYGTFLVLYVAAQLAGLISQVPGGIGVFEGSFLLLASNHYPSSGLLAALIAYRSIYYLLPLIISAFILAAYEFWAQILRRGLQEVEPVISILRAATPQIFSVLLLLGGCVLLFSGVTPAEPSRLKWLDYFLPLTLIEFSHLAGSIAGVMLLFLSRAVAKRMDTAYVASIITLAIGIIVSLVKGLDYEEASILSIMLLLFLPTRHQFYRKSSLFALDVNAGWLTLCGIVLGLSTWLGFFSYKHIEYSDSLWWQFSLHGDASRFLRSMLAVAVLGTGFILYRLITHTAQQDNLPDDETLDRIKPLILNANETMSNLAFLGDKKLFFSETGQSFIMYDTTPNCWIAMGDPVGHVQEFENLVWRWREAADRYAAKIAFYQVSTSHLPLYLDLGLGLIKLGEEARVSLTEFSLDGKKGKSLRHAHNKLEQEGFTFEIVPMKDVPSLLPELKEISDAWMFDKNVKEKRFSLGFFKEQYLARFDMGIIRKGEKLVAFANIWKTDNKHEISIDLMRYRPDIVNGVMEHLMVSLIIWGKANGYQWFNLGMAPLSGLEKHPLAPLWHKIGNTIFRFGSEFYNFEGLYQYKSKFQPHWQPRYLATPTGLKVASTLLSVTSLISNKPELKP